ncbi:hypothetical protein OS493_012607 [Desmophyllum pertusum]|uniref:Uncharacterized protein n=1 Tax=Desmophyllum pertusum TaxID=174260 RepID=A0A9W9ZEJ8_9CNID|nr:hypothetical protein OS493_012607 [Desmophyllum pertusum]
MKEGEEQIFMDSDKPLYPYIALTDGCSVLVKMCSREDPDNFASTGAMKSEDYNIIEKICENVTTLIKKMGEKGERGDPGTSCKCNLQDYVELQRESRVLPLAGQEEPRDQTEALASDAQMDQLMENIAPCASVVESQFPDEAPSWEAAEEDTLHSNDGESAVEGDTNEEQREVESSNMERRDIADDQSHADSSWKFPSSQQEADAIPDQTKPDNTCLRQEGDISDSNLVPLGSTADYLASTEASSETNGEEAIEAQSSRAASQGSVPNLRRTSPPAYCHSSGLKSPV